MRKWYWVKLPSGEWFPATRDRFAAGGWTNLDTWEDWEREVQESIEMHPLIKRLNLILAGMILLAFVGGLIVGWFCL